MNLTACIKKAGKALDADDAAAIRALRDNLVGDGASAKDAAIQAVRLHMADVLAEREGYAGQLKDAAAPDMPELPNYSQETSDATEVREDAGQPEAEGQERQGSEADSGGDVQQEPQARAKAGDKEKIEDFGEKIEGARKDTFTGFRDALQEDVDVSAAPLSKSFPKPDYKKLAEGGVPKRVLAHIALLRDSIPTKPRRGWKLKKWAEQVASARDASQKLLTKETAVDEYERVMQIIPGFEADMARTAEAIEDVAPEDIPKAAEYRIASGKFSLLYGKEYKPAKQFWYLQGPKRRQVRDPFSNDPSMPGTHRDNPKEVVELAKRIIALNLSSEEEQKPTRSKYTAVNVYRDRSTGDNFLGFKVRSTVIRLKGGFEDVASARAYLEENRDDVQAKIDEMRKGPNMRGTENRPRSGEALREGDVTPAMFADAFKFRGVQFGNYVEGGRRQADLNRAYDALMDLADVLGVPPQALSLNGSLGLAFGARGKGGRNAAAAHYESGQIVINLTKGGGPGSLAHEFLHALDNYFARQDEASGYMSERRRDSGPVRDEVYQAWKQLEDTLKKGDFAKRSAEFDKPRSKPYWNTTIEKAARAFERYIVDRLSEKGAANDYLANIDTEGGAYPTAEEMQSQGIRAAFDNLFATIETKETDDGNVMLFSKSAKVGATPKGMELADVEKTIETFFEKFPGARPVTVRVHRSQERAFGPAGRRYGRVKAGYAPGSDTLHIVAENLSGRQELVSTLQHELLVHKGLGIFPEAERQELIDLIRTESPKSKSLGAIRDKVLENYFDQSPQVQAEEVLAHIAERKYNGLDRVWTKILNIVRRALEKLGFVKPGLTRRQLIGKVYEIGEAFREGRQAGSRAGEMRFAKSDYPFTLSGQNPSDSSQTGRQAQALLARNWNGDPVESAAMALQEAKATASRDVVDWIETNRDRLMSELFFSKVNDDSDADKVMAEKLGLGGKPPNKILRTITSFKDRNMREALDALGGRMYEGLLDGLVGIKRAEDRAGKGIKAKDYGGSGYVGARLATGIADTMHAILHYGAPRWGQDGVLEHTEGTRGLLKIFEDLGSDLNDWLGWMAGNRGAELMAQGREQNLTEDDIKALQGLSKGRQEKFQQAKDEYSAMNRAMLDLAEQAGLIDPDARAQWESEWYVPFYRHSEADADAPLLAPRTSRGLSHQTAGIKMLKGGKASTNDLLENIITNWMKLTDASMKNMALLKTVDNLKDTEYLEDETTRWRQVVVSKSEIAKRIKQDRKTMAAVAEFLGLPADSNLEKVANELEKVDSKGFEKLWAPVAPTDTDIIRIQRGGKNEYYRVNDPALLRAVTHLGSRGLEVTRAGRWFKRLLTTGVTTSPDFMLRNFIRDAAHAWAINPDRDKKTGFKFGKDSLKGLKGAFTEDSGYRELMFSGASFQGGYVHGTDPEATAQIIRRALERKGLTRQEIDSHMGSVLDTPGKVKRAIQEGWQAYRNVGDKVENANRLSTYRAARASGKDVAQAVFEAKDLMDYSLRGNFQLMVGLTDVVPFLNARLQGLSKLGRAGKANKRLVAAAVGKIALFSTALAMLNDDDERYQELPEWDKDMYWHFWIGDQHWRIPKPFEIGIIGGTIPERMYHTWVRDNQPDRKLKESLQRAVFDTLSFNPIPQIALPVAEVVANKSFFFDRPIEGMADEGKLPQDRFNAHTSTAMVEIGQLFGMSPKKLQHLWEGYTGTMGAYALSVTDMLVRYAQSGDAPRPAWRVSDLPAVKSFYRGDAPARSTQYVTDFYDRMKEVNQIYRSMRDYMKTDPEKSRELLEENKDKLRYRKVLDRTNRRMSALRKRRDRIMHDQDMSRKEKRDQLDEINAMINRAAKQATELTEEAF